MLDTLEFGAVEPVVRVNSLRSGVTEADLSVCLSANRLPSTVMLPKVDHTAELDEVISCNLILSAFIGCNPGRSKLNKSHYSVIRLLLNEHGLLTI